MYQIVNMPDLKIKSFTNHIVRSGKSGSGKTNSAEFELENIFLFKKNKYKCVDFDTSGRFENCSYSLAEDNPKLIDKMQDFPDLVENWDLKPMSFKDEVILFCGRGLVSYPKLPSNFKICSFKKEDLRIEIIQILLGDTPALLPLLNSMQLKYGFDLNLKDIWDILVNNNFRGKKTIFTMQKVQKSMIITRILSWIQTGMFNDNVKKIDFEEVFNDNSKITCFNSMLQYTEAEEEILYAMLMDKILYYMTYRKLNYRIYLFIREIHDYINWKLCNYHLNQILRKGRTLGKAGIDLSSDTQRPVDLPPVLRRQFGFYFQLRGDQKDAEKMGEVQFVPPKDMFKVPRFKIGQGIMLTGGRYDTPIEIPPARHKHVDTHTDIIELLGATHGWQEIDIFNILDEGKVYSFEKEKIKIDKKAIRELISHIQTKSDYVPTINNDELTTILKYDTKFKEFDEMQIKHIVDYHNILQKKQKLKENNIDGKEKKEVKQYPHYCAKCEKAWISPIEFPIKCPQCQSKDILPKKN